MWLQILQTYTRELRLCLVFRKIWLHLIQEDLNSTHRKRIHPFCPCISLAPQAHLPLDVLPHDCPQQGSRSPTGTDIQRLLKTICRQKFSVAIRNPPKCFWLYQLVPLKNNFYAYTLSEVTSLCAIFLTFFSALLPYFIFFFKLHKVFPMRFDEG